MAISGRMAPILHTLIVRFPIQMASHMYVAAMYSRVTQCFPFGVRRLWVLVSAWVNMAMVEGALEVRFARPKECAIASGQITETSSVLSPFEKAVNSG